MIKILVDAMGGDEAPSVVVEGAILAMQQQSDLHIVFTGRKDAVQAELQKYKYDESRVEVVDCPDVVDMNDIPTEVIRTKKQSSLIQGFWMLKKQDDICGLVTAGSSGATIVAAQTILGRIRGIRRPGLCCLIPNVRNRYTYLCDCGANAEVKPVMLCQFAVMASVFASAMGVESPAVGLLNNGTEEHKGDPLHQQTYGLLNKLDNINFVGNVEGRDVMFGQNIDVIVADGFSGNVALKSVEGCAKMMLAEIKKAFKVSLLTKIGYLLTRKGIKAMRANLDFEKLGGAILLGAKKIVIKSHGSSKASTICSSILSACNFHQRDLINKIESSLSSVNWDEIIPAEEV